MANKINYSNLVQLLKTRGFIDIERVTRNGRDYFLANYGPLGTLLRQNILKQWWELMVVQQSNVFPVECPVFQTSPNGQPDSSGSQLPNQDTNWRDNLQQDCLSKYLQVLHLTNGRLPISIVTVGSCLSWRDMQSDAPEEKALLFGASNMTKVLLQHYTPPTGTSTVFDYWLQLRLSWWKKFSRNPANFTVSSDNESSHNNGTVGATTVSTSDSKLNSQPQYSMCITYEFPWGPETIEEVKNFGDKRLSYLQEFGDQSYKGKTVDNKSCLPHCIECSSSIEAATAAWLVDSFHERRPPSAKRQIKTSMVLQLHPKIAPYQVAIVISSPTTSSSSVPPSTEIHHVCVHLEKDFQKAGISVFNTSQHGSTLEAHLKRNDQLGIPYTVIVTGESLTEGVVNIRHRDTGIQSSTHMSDIVDILSRNLRAQLEEHE